MEQQIESEETMNDPQYDQPWMRLFQVAVDWDRGELHRHAEILAVMGLSDIGNAYYRGVGQCRWKLLETHNKWLEGVHKIGYRCIDAKDHLASSARRVQQAKRRARQGMAIAIHTEMSLLSDDERQRHLDYLARGAAMLAGFEEQEKDLARLAAAYKGLIEK